MTSANPFLFTLASDPLDRLTSAIYADWLFDQPDQASQARAELVQVQNRILDGVSSEKELLDLQQREQLLLQRIDQSWQGSIRHSCQKYHFHRGLLHVAMQGSDFLRLQDQQTEWEKARISSLALTSVEPRMMEHLARAPLLKNLPSLHLPRLHLEDSQISPVLQSHNLRQLRVLDLSNNLLTEQTLQSLFHTTHFPELQRLDLRNNRIANLDQAIRPRFRIDLHGNPLPILQTQLLPSRQNNPSSERFINRVGMEFVRIPPGCFHMGSTDGEEVRQKSVQRPGMVDERPRHLVRISRPFHLSIYPVTQQQFYGVMGYNPSEHPVDPLTAPFLPVDNVSWEQAALFCQRLSERESARQAGHLYRLPTEAEWEYACRAGTTSPFHWGQSASFGQLHFDPRHPYGQGIAVDKEPVFSRVGEFPPNPHGLHDMHGNCWEWCHDWYQEDWYQLSGSIDPHGPAEGNRKVCRGGSCDSPATDCRSSFREYWYGIKDGIAHVGFRVAATLLPS